MVSTRPGEASPMMATRSPGVPAARRPTIPPRLTMATPGKAKLRPTSSPNSCCDIQRGTAAASNSGMAAFPPPKARKPIFTQAQNSSSNVPIISPPHPVPASDHGWTTPVALVLYELQVDIYLSDYGSYYTYCLVLQQHDFHVPVRLDIVP